MAAFDLRVVPVGAIHPHEEVDPARVERLARRLASDRVLVNPPVVISHENEFVLLDGATRHETARRLRLQGLAVQVVDRRAVRLGRWFHLVSGIEDLVRHAAALAECRLTTGEVGTVATIWSERIPVGVDPAEGQTRWSASRALIRSYGDHGAVERTVEADPQIALAGRPGVALVTFPEVTFDDVITAAAGEDRLPAGVTRFEVPDRVLHLNLDLGMLESGDIAAADSFVRADAARRVQDGRARRYAEPVWLLDD